MSHRLKGINKYRKKIEVSNAIIMQQENKKNEKTAIKTYYTELYDDLNSTTQQKLYTFGGNDMGQLGQGILVESSADPLIIEALSNMDIVSFNTGEGHSVCVSKKGQVYSWGASACGQLGIDKPMSVDYEGYPIQPFPKLISFFNDIKIIKVACGDTHTLALSDDNLVYSWGGSGCGQLGHSDISTMLLDEDKCPYLPFPKLIEAIALEKMRDIACGKVHSISINIKGHAYTWGAGSNGQLGLSKLDFLPLDEDGYHYQPIPKLVEQLKKNNIVQAVCGDIHTMVLTNTGKVLSFGGGACGQLGLGPLKQPPIDKDKSPFISLPAKVQAFSNKKIIFIAARSAQSMAIDSEGNLYSWGTATYGQLGIGENITKLLDINKNHYLHEPNQVTALKNIKAVSVSCGENHSIVLTEGGALYSFGMNNYNQLGLPKNETIDTNNRDHLQEMINTPKLLTSFFPYNITAIDCGGVHNLISVKTPNNSNFILYTFLQKEILTDYLLILNNQNLFLIRCHKHILISRSKYFYDAIVTNNKTFSNEMILDNILNIKHFKTIIEYIYLEDLSLVSSADCEEKDLIEYLKYAKLFQLSELEKKIQKIIEIKFTEYSEALKLVYKKYSQTYSTAFNGLFFLTNGTPMLLLDNKLVDSVIENSLIISANSQDNNGLQNVNQLPDNNNSSMNSFICESLSFYEAILKNGLNSPLLTKFNINFNEKILDKLHLFNQESTSDVMIKVSNGMFYCNKVILACSSLFFDVIIEGMKENKTNQIIIDDYTADNFVFILLLFYFENNITFDLNTNLEILKRADMLQIRPYLIAKIETDVIALLSVTTVTKIYTCASSYKYQRLKQLCIYFIIENYIKVVESPQFEALEHNQMIEIICICKSSSLNKAE